MQLLTRWQSEIENAALSSGALCIAVFSTEDRSLLFGNNAFRLLMHGTASETLINPSFDDLLAFPSPPDAAEPIYEGMLTIGSESQINTTIQTRVFRKDGQLLITGEVDLNRIVKQNQQMAELNRETNNLQRQLTKEKILLEQTLADLKEANEQLAILHEEKNRFMNMAAHDLRNPISAAISYADVLINDPDSFPRTQQQQFLRNIEERLQFSLRLMTELLDISKIDAGNVKLKRELNDYTSLLRNTVGFNQIVAKYKNIEIRLECPEHPWHFVFDRNKIEQALNNLISNAIKYSHRNSTVIVRATEEDMYARTAVIDKGLGIKENELPYIFQPFHKSSTRPTAGESSTGLGLAISKKIIEEHGGKLQVNSKKGEGSCFSFLLPVQDKTAN
ncbi:MAG: sensor histidine kinase [Bacteroidales bacterium]